MYSDLTRVRQCLLNLISNACKFTRNGTIRLETTRETGANGEQVVFRVSDTGIGMTAGQIDRLFQAFTQADASTTRKYGGTGLGLAITKRISQMLGGDVTVESQPEQGSTFTLWFPAGLGEMTTEAASPSSEEAVPQSVTPPIPVSDDNAIPQDLRAPFSVPEGASLAHAASSQNGLHVARGRAPSGRADLAPRQMSSCSSSFANPGVNRWPLLRFCTESKTTNNTKGWQERFLEAGSESRTGETQKSDRKACPRVRKWISSEPLAGHDLRRVARKPTGGFGPDHECLSRRFLSGTILMTASILLAALVFPLQTERPQTVGCLTVASESGEFSLDIPGKLNHRTTRTAQRRRTGSRPDSGVQDG